jgi:uncharacterized membrane protein
MLSERVLLDAAFIGCTITSAVSLFVSINNSKMRGTTFANHPIFASVGFSTVASAAYLLSRERKRTDPMVLGHQCAMIVGTGSVWFALYFIYGVKEANRKKHLQTTHSWFGIGAAAMLTFLTVTTSLAMREKANPQTRRKLMKRHTLVGTLAVCCLTVAVYTGALSTFKSPQTRALVGGTAVAAVSVLVFSANLKRTPADGKMPSL